LNQLVRRRLLLPRTSPLGPPAKPQFSPAVPGVALQKFGDGELFGGAEGFVAGDLGDHRQQAGIHVLPLLCAHDRPPAQAVVG
jgi:hypothetical protein